MLKAERNLKKMENEDSVGYSQGQRSNVTAFDDVPSQKKGDARYPGAVAIVAGESLVDQQSVLLNFAIPQGVLMKDRLCA